MCDFWKIHSLMTQIEELSGRCLQTKEGDTGGKRGEKKVTKELKPRKLARDGLKPQMKRP